MQIGTRHLKTPGFHFPHLPQPRSRFGKIVKAVLPLVFIAIGVYVFFNFPALLQRLTYTLDKPKPGSSAQFPAKATGLANSIEDVCADKKPVSYDNDGNAKAFCDNYIYIPRIRVGAPIVWPKQTDDKTINDALLQGVVHYPGTAEPGQKGNVFLTGHSSFYWWVKSDYKTVFTLVPQLIGGDKIYVYNRGVRYVYQVTETFDVNPNQTEVLKPTTDAMVTLSTCVPIGTANKRRIVRAKQVEPDPKFNRNASSSSAFTPTRLPGVR